MTEEGTILLRQGRSALLAGPREIKVLGAGKGEGALGFGRGGAGFLLLRWGRGRRRLLRRRVGAGLVAGEEVLARVDVVPVAQVRVLLRPQGRAVLQPHRGINRVSEVKGVVVLQEILRGKSHLNPPGSQGGGWGEVAGQPEMGRDSVNMHMLISKHTNTYRTHIMYGCE